MTRLDQVRELTDEGKMPKEIAEILGIRPIIVSHYKQIIRKGFSYTDNLNYNARCMGWENWNSYKAYLRLLRKPDFSESYRNYIQRDFEEEMVQDNVEETAVCKERAPDREYEFIESLDKLNLLLDDLEQKNPMWREIIEMRYYREMTLEQIGKVFEFTRENIRIKCKSALEFLRSKARSVGLV